MSDEELVSGRLCRRCNLRKAESLFYRYNIRYKNGSPRFSSYCKDCDKTRVTSRQKENPEHTNLVSKCTRNRGRLSVLQHYSDGEPKCIKCGFKDQRALTIDHIAGDGAEHRRKINCKDGHIHKWIIKNNFPPIFQILCANCNTLKKVKELNQHTRTTREYEYQLEVKFRVFLYYSNHDVRCSKCKSDIINSLSLDHTDGDGNKHRKENKIRAGYQTYLWLIRNNFPEGYQILCMNCNYIKRYEEDKLYTNTTKVSDAFFQKK